MHSADLIAIIDSDLSSISLIGDADPLKYFAQLQQV